MELITCEYCGTEFGANESECPLCGRIPGKQPTPVPAGQQPRSGGARLNQTKHTDRIPRWMWALSCVFLAIAVIGGGLYFLWSMGYIGSKDSQPAVQIQNKDPLPEATTDPGEQQPDVQQPDNQQPDDQQPGEQQPEEQQPDGTTCTELTLSLTSVVLDQKGSMIFLTAVAKPNDCTDPITYTSSDDNVVKVTDKGLVEAVGPGTAEIYVSCGRITKICQVTCEFEDGQQPPEEEEPPVEEQPDEEEPDEDQPAVQPSLSKTDITMTRPGETYTLKVKDAPTGAKITFSSADSKVATVTATGLITAVGTGTTNVTVTVNDEKLTCIVRCNLGTSAEDGGDGEQHPGPFKLVNEYGTEGDATLTYNGESCTLKLLDANGKEVEGLTWTTNNAAVATVNANGKVTAVGKGKTTITTVYAGQTFTFIIRCNF